MLTYSFANIGSDALYEHLYKCIKTDILSGHLRSGDKLPSKRSFAKNLNISTITVENAYAQLMAEGYIYSIPKKGYFVTNLQTLSRPKSSAHIVTIRSRQTSDKWFADFVSNQTNPAHFPFSIWTKLMREVISTQSTELMRNSPSGGILELRTAIAQHLKQFRNMNVLPEQIIVGAGTEYLYSLLIQLLGRDKIYAVEDPGYRKLSQIYQSQNAVCKHIPMDKDGIIPDVLEEQNVDIVHLSPSHHYPTGMVTPVSRRYELLGWTSKSDSRYIIEDDYDSEFRLMGKPLPTLQSIDVTEKVIYMNTFTKSLASTIRISYMVLPPHLIERFYSQLSFYACTVSTFEQYTLANFIHEGYFEKHINRMRNYYRNQRDTLIACIKNNPASSFLQIREEDAGLHFLIQVHKDLSDKEIKQRTEQAGIRISCLSEYYYDKTMLTQMYPTLIMNYSGLQEENLEEAIHRLCQCLEQ